MASGANSFNHVLQEIKWEQVTESKVSTVMAFLPISLQSRISPLRTLRRSMSLSSLKQRGQAALPSGSQSPLRPLLDGDTPGPDDERLVAGIVETDHSRKMEKGVSQLQLAMSSSQGRHMERGEGDLPAKTTSGLHLRFARQGQSPIYFSAHEKRLNLKIGASLVYASIEGGRTVAEEDTGGFERKAYIDGLAYLLRGLPQDLDEYEAEQVCAALPVSVSHRRVDSLTQGRQGALLTDTGGEPGRSLLHRAVQRVVVSIIFIIHVILPYLMQVFKFGARMERKYKVSERVVGHGMDFANMVGKQSVSVTDGVYKMNDGRIGRGVSDVAAWILDGITRGISDGVGEGMMMVRLSGTT